jgi:hypothetical protein
MRYGLFLFMLTVVVSLYTSAQAAQESVVLCVSGTTSSSMLKIHSKLDGFLLINMENGPAISFDKVLTSGGANSEVVDYVYGDVATKITFKEDNITSVNIGDGAIKMTELMPAPKAEQVLMKAMGVQRRCFTGMIEFYQGQ